MLGVPPRIVKDQWMDWKHRHSLRWAPKSLKGNGKQSNHPAYFLPPNMWYSPGGSSSTSLLSELRYGKADKTDLFSWSQPTRMQETWFWDPALHFQIEWLHKPFADLRLTFSFCHVKGLNLTSSPPQVLWLLSPKSVACIYVFFQEKPWSRHLSIGGAPRAR